MGIQLTRTIYTPIPPVSSVSIEATLPRGGVQFLCRKPLRQPCKSRPSGNRNKMVFLQPVSTFEITWEDFMRGKVNQVQKHIPNYFSSPVFATSGCTTRCCLSQWVIYLGKKKIVQEDAIAYSMCCKAASISQYPRGCLSTATGSSFQAKYWLLHSPHWLLRASRDQQHAPVV